MLVIAAAFPQALAQSAKDLAGTYTIVAVTIVQGDKTIEPFGPTPKGVMMLDTNGRYVVKPGHRAGKLHSLRDV
jgi:hypothetical protein